MSYKILTIDILQAYILEIESIKNYLDELELLFSDDKTLISKELAEIEERRKYLEALQNRKG